MVESSSPDSDTPETDQTELTWDDSFAIALALRLAHPEIDLEDVSLGMIYQWTLALREFSDDPQLANEGILASIYQEWFEEVIST